MIKIVSINVNGIRSATSKGLVEWIKINDPDIICFQEIKANEADIPLEIKELSQYKQFWNPAAKKGYSGVGIMTKIEPNAMRNRFKIEEYDAEGRLLMLDFHDFTLISAYFPSGTTGDLRQAFKEKFLEDFYELILELKQSGKRLIITGDVNICHKPIDIHNPVSNKNSSGFLPHERQWMDRFFEMGFCDAFREVNQEPHQYTWWSFRSGARSKNLGWRIDYHLVDKDLRPRVRNYKIHADVVLSDHCPIELHID